VPLREGTLGSVLLRLSCPFCPPDPGLLDDGRPSEGLSCLSIFTTSIGLWRMPPMGPISCCARSARAIISANDFFLGGALGAPAELSGAAVDPPLRPWTPDAGPLGLAILPDWTLFSDD
jgi:hypothetical protein